MSAYLASYLAIAVSIRLLAGYLTIIEIGLLRSIGSLAIAGSIVWASGSGRQHGFLPAKPRDDILRSVLHLAGSLALIWSLSHLPLALVTTIEFTGPLFAGVLLFLTLRRRPGTVPALGLALLASGISLLLLKLNAVPNSDIAIAIAAVAVLTTTNLMLASLAANRSTLSPAPLALRPGAVVAAAAALSTRLPSAGTGGDRRGRAGIDRRRLRLAGCAGQCIAPRHSAPAVQRRHVARAADHAGSLFDSGGAAAERSASAGTCGPVRRHRRQPAAAGWLPGAPWSERYARPALAGQFAISKTTLTCVR